MDETDDVETADTHDARPPGRGPAGITTAMANDEIDRGSAETIRASMRSGHGQSMKAAQDAPEGMRGATRLLAVEDTPEIRVAPAGTDGGERTTTRRAG